MGSDPTSEAGRAESPQTRRNGRMGRRQVGQRAHLSIEDVVELRQTLMQRRVGLVAEISRLQNETAGGGTDPAAPPGWRGRGDSDGASEDPWGRVLARVSIDRKLALLHEIDLALKRMEENTYGYDEATGAPIPRERLREVPWARSC
jgi:RNA polymerase-binding transcription factor DksA